MGTDWGAILHCTPAACQVLDLYRSAIYVFQLSQLLLATTGHDAAGRSPPVRPMTSYFDTWYRWPVNVTGKSEYSALYGVQS
jgi:hypothetical protein